MIYSRHAALCVAALACGALSCGAPARADDVAAAPISEDGGDYPLQAGGLEAAVYVGYDIGASGQVNDVSVLGSTEPGVFDQAAIATVQGWRFHPRLLNEQATTQTGNEVLLRFVPPADQLLPPVQLVSLPAYYTEALYRAHQEGGVTLSYNVTEMGDVALIHVVNATNPGKFDRLAMFELSRQKFLPATQNGVPQAALDLTVTFQYRLADAVIMPKLSRRPQFKYSSFGNEFRGVPVLASAPLQIDQNGRVVVAKALTRIENSDFREQFLESLKASLYQPLPEDIATHQAQILMIRDSLVIRNQCCTGEIDPANLGLPPHSEWVRLSYTLKADGHLTDVQVIGASSNANDQASVAAQFAQQQLSPIIVRGVAQSVTGLHTVLYNPGQNDYEFLRQSPIYLQGSD